MDMKPIVAICAMIVALTSVAGLLALGDWDEMREPITDTIQKKQAGWRGFGQFPDLPEDEREYGEVFDSTLYFTSWDAGGKSEKIIVGGVYAHTKEDWVHCSPDKYLYAFYLWDGTGDIDLGGEKGDGWEKLNDDQLGDDYIWEQTIVGGLEADNTYDAKTTFFKLDGKYEDGATILVIFQIHCWLGDWVTLAGDEARLVQGDGDLTWSKMRYRVGVDTHAELSWFVPAIRSEVEGKPVYKIFVTNENTGKIIYEEYVDDMSGSIKIEITEDMSVPMGKNRLIARLWNDIFQKDVTSVGMAIEGGHCAPGDDVCVGPTMNKVTTDKAKYWEGETVTVTIDATNGTYPIDYYFLLCEIEGTEIFNAETDDSVVQVQASTLGIVHCEAMAYDFYGNPSEMREAKADVDNRSPREKEEDDDDKEGMNWYEGLIFALAVAALLLLVGIEAWVLNMIGFDDWRVMLGVIGTTLIVGMIFIGMLFVSFSTNGLTPPTLW